MSSIKRLKFTARTIRSDSVQFWRNIYKEQIPVVVEGAISEWECFCHPSKTWTLTYLKGVHSKKKIVIEAYGNYMSKNMKMLTVSFEEYVDHLMLTESQGDKRCADGHVENHVYLAQTDISEFEDLLSVFCL